MIAATETYPRRLIEVDLPIATVSEHARNGRSVHHGHITAIHVWWARKPLPSCRAAALAASLIDPLDPACPESFRRIQCEGPKCGADVVLTSKFHLSRRGERSVGLRIAGWDGPTPRFEIAEGNLRSFPEASYPFHPSLLSVFERKWQGLPRFQQTRGVLRLLALWVSKAYSEGYKGAHKDPLISLGTAPLEDPLFRAALFEQLGEARLEPAVTTDIAGKDHAHALRLDAEATPELKKARLHRTSGAPSARVSHSGPRFASPAPRAGRSSAAEQPIAARSGGFDAVRGDR